MCTHVGFESCEVQYRTVYLRIVKVFFLLACWIDIAGWQHLGTKYPQFSHLAEFWLIYLLYILYPLGSSISPCMDDMLVFLWAYLAMNLGSLDHPVSWQPGAMLGNNPQPWFYDRHPLSWRRYPWTTSMLRLVPWWVKSITSWKISLDFQRKNPHAHLQNPHGQWKIQSFCNRKILSSLKWWIFQLVMQ